MKRVWLLFAKMCRPQIQRHERFTNSFCFFSQTVTNPFYWGPSWRSWEAVCVLSPTAVIVSSSKTCPPLYICIKAVHREQEVQNGSRVSAKWPEAALSHCSESETLLFEKLTFITSGNCCSVMKYQCSKSSKAVIVFASCCSRVTLTLNTLNNWMPAVVKLCF